jgi:hypothetical protein
LFEQEFEDPLKVAQGSPLTKENTPQPDACQT